MNLYVYYANFISVLCCQLVPVFLVPKICLARATSEIRASFYTILALYLCNCIGSVSPDLALHVYPII